MSHHETDKVYYEVRTHPDIVLYRSRSLKYAKTRAERLCRIETIMQEKYGSKVWPSRKVTVHKCEEIVE